MCQERIDLFSVHATQMSIDSGIYVEYHMISSVTSGAPVEFDVTANEDD
jgi:hypothetical protein